MRDNLDDRADNSTLINTYPVIDGKCGHLQHHGDHVDGAVKQGGLKLFFQVRKLFFP